MLRSIKILKKDLLKIKTAVQIPYHVNTNLTKEQLDINYTDMLDNLSRLNCIDSEYQIHKKNILAEKQTLSRDASLFLLNTFEHEIKRTNSIVLSYKQSIINDYIKYFV